METKVPVILELGILIESVMQSKAENGVIINNLPRHLNLHVHVLSPKI